MYQKACWSIFLIGLLFSQACFLNRGPKLHAPIQLKTNYQSQPLGLSPDGIFFSWWVSDDRQDAIQTAWQIQVGTDSLALAEGEEILWDSEQQTAGREAQIPYAGPELAPLRRYFWRVRTWDGESEASDFSIPEPFETGPTEWQAQWIGDGSQAPERDEAFYEDHPAPLFRKSFVLEEMPTAARLHIAGLGYYETYLNGKKSSTAVLEPGWTNFDKRVLYSTYPVEDQLVVGENVLGVMLGNGWYNPLPLRLFGRWNLREILATGQPKLMAELHLEFADGGKEVIPTDLSWQTKPGWILRNNVYLGETHDGRQKDPHWCQAQSPEQLKDWEAVQAAIPPKASLLPQEQPPVKITQYLQPQTITEPEPGVYVVDFGQNFAGWVKLELAGKAGQQVRLRYGELLYEDGLVNGHTAMTTQIKAYTGLKGGPGAPTDAWQESNYTLGGFEGEYFQPHFSFHGFRYVQIEGYPGKLSPDRIKGLRLSAALKGAGSFVSGNQAFNQIQDATLWTFLSNVFSVQSDCPAREKFGYGGDMVTASEAFVYNFDMANFYRKTVQDFADDARPLGGMPECAPNNDIASEGLGDGSGPIGWQLAYPFLQEVLYRFYGDRQIIEAQYPTVQRMVKFLQSVAPDDRIRIGLSDHALLNEKPTSLSSSAFYYHIVQLAGRFATILGKEAEAEAYQELASRIQTATFAEEFDPETGCFNNCNQSAQTIALWYDWLTEEQRALALARYQDSLNRWDGHNSTGIFGTKMAFDVLRREEQAEVAYTFANQPDQPGWRYMIDNGATTLWEEWYTDQHIYSHNHPMFGSISEWFYRSIGGINPAPDAVGCDRWIIAPQLTDSVPSATVSYQSIRGLVSSTYTRTDSSLQWRVSIPANTQAEVAIPLDGYLHPRVELPDESLYWSETESTEPSATRKGDRLWVKLGSGTYDFVVSESPN